MVSVSPETLIPLGNSPWLGTPDLINAGRPVSNDVLRFLVTAVRERTMISILDLYAIFLANNYRLVRISF